MLKRIPINLSPELIKILMEMGHGDEIVLADGHDAPSLLDSILKFFPLDTSVEATVKFMETVDPSEDELPIWKTYQGILSKSSGTEVQIEYIRTV